MRRPQNLKTNLSLVLTFLSKCQNKSEIFFKFCGLLEKPEQRFHETLSSKHLSGPKLKFMYSEKAIKFCEISTIDLTITTYIGQIYGGDSKKICGLLRLYEL